MDDTNHAKIKHQDEGRVFRPTYRGGCNFEILSATGCMMSITLPMLYAFTAPVFRAIGLPPAVILILPVILFVLILRNFPVPARHYLVLTDDKLVWVENGRRGETTWDNLENLEGYSGQLSIRLHTPVQVTTTLPEPPTQKISLAHYSDGTGPFFFRRTLLGEALYRKAPQIFARLEEQEKTMGFMHRFQDIQPMAQKQGTSHE